MQLILSSVFFFFFNDTATTEIYTLPLHDALPISRRPGAGAPARDARPARRLEPALPLLVPAHSRSGRRCRAGSRDRAASREPPADRGSLARGPARRAGAGGARYLAHRPGARRDARGRDAASRRARRRWRGGGRLGRGGAHWARP